MIKNVEKNQTIAKSENFETLYKNLEKYGSFSEFRTSTEKSVILATLLRSFALSTLVCCGNSVQCGLVRAVRAQVCSQLNMVLAFLSTVQCEIYTVLPGTVNYVSFSFLA